MWPFTLNLIKPENEDSVAQTHEPHVRRRGAARGWWPPCWRARWGTPIPTDGSAGRHCTAYLPAASFSPSPSHPSYGLQHFLRRSSDTVMPRPCLKTSVGCWHMVCAPQQGTQVLHCPFRLPSKLGDPCPSKPRLSPLAPFLSARSAPSSSPSEKAHHPSLVVMLPHCLATCVCCPGLPI